MAGRRFAAVRRATCPLPTAQLFSPTGALLKNIDFEELTRHATTLLAAVFTAWLLHTRGWPWYSWVPATLLVAVAVVGLWVIVWYVRRKLSYPRRARATKADLRRGGSGWPGAAPPTP